MSTPLTMCCPDCEGARTFTIPGGACIRIRPMSTCDGDCSSRCAATGDCPTCGGTGEVPDRTKVCVVCLEEDGKVAASVADNLCAECMDSVGSFALSVAS